MKTSIIIPSYGRPQVLDDCLESINKIKNEIPKPYEIIVVNNNNEKMRKDTSRVCKKYELNIKEVSTEPLGSIGARNAGLRKATGEILVMFDDDTLIQKGYFKQLMKHYENEKVGAVGGSEDKTGQKGIVHKLFFKMHKVGDVTWSGEITSNFNPRLKKPVLVKHLHGSNFSMRKKVLKKIRLMDEKMIGHYRDDTEFTYRIYEAGYEIVFEPRARVIHTATDTGGNVSPENKKKWAYWYHRNTSYFFFKHLYYGNKIRLIAYLLRETLTSIIRTIIYVNPHYLTQMGAISEGKKLTNPQK